MRINKLSEKLVVLTIGLILGYFLNFSLYAQESLEEQEFFAARPSGIMSEEVQPGGIVKDSFLEELKSETVEITDKTNLVLLAEYKRTYDGLKRYEESMDKIIDIMSEKNVSNKVLDRYQTRRDIVHKKRMELFKEIMIEKKK